MWIVGAIVAMACSAAPSLPGASNHTDLTRFCDVPAEGVAGVVDEIAALPTLSARLLSASERFLGVRYQLDPLGEGPGQPPDEDPRLSWDRADCQTFVETALAVARARSAREVLAILDDVRYDGPPRYPNRNHFFEAHWVAANVRKGYVVDVTTQIGGQDAIEAVKTVTLASWSARTFAPNIHLPQERAPVGRFPVPFLPLGRVLARAKDIPSGTLFAVIREDRSGVPTQTTHLGIVVQKPDGTYLRHAGSDLYAQVVDEAAAHFVQRNAAYRKWPVLGLRLLAPVEGRGPAQARPSEPKPVPL